MSAASVVGSVLIRKILRAARKHVEETGELAQRVYVCPQDFESLKAWSRENLWFIINDDDEGRWQIDGIPLKVLDTLTVGEIKID